MLTLFKLLYGETKYRVKLMGKFSDPFLVKQGLKQGCLAACLLFNIYFSVIIHVCHEKLSDKGVQIRFRLNGDIFDIQKLKAESKISKITIAELLFADDAALCALNEQDLQLMVLVFYETFIEFGLELAIEKTEVMMQKATKDEERESPKIYINENLLKVSHKFKYLGCQLQDDATNSAEIAWRISQSTAAFSKLYQRVWKKRHISLKTKIKTYRAIIIPCMIYGSEAWNCSKRELQKLNGLQYRQLRTILGKKWSDKISHVELLHSIKFERNENFEWALSDEDKSKDQNLPAMETLIRLNRLRYFGHVLRMDDSRLPKIVINSEVNAGKRARGCPKKNYRACIKEDLKLFGMWEHYPDLVITASERSLWRRKIHQGAIVFQKKMGGR